jgi:formylglycine-generating enzyme required for sulfatase activity
MEGRVVIARAPVPEVSKPSLPGWITEALTSGAYSARLAAVGELAQLSQGADRSLAALARAELERLSREDENPTVRGAASGALGTTVAGAQVKVEARPVAVPPQPERIEAPGPDRKTWEKDSKEMVRVPAGRFLYSEEKKEFLLPAFWIDRTPVTNAEYERFVIATGHKPPGHWKGRPPPEDAADHPVVRVTWHDAVAYAEWAGKRLPTEKQWEKAARGTDGRAYPWSDWAEGRCNTKEAGIERTTPVGQYSPGGDSPYGGVDMAGNVFEWTKSEHENRRGSRVVRGGSWHYDRDFARCAARFKYLPGYSNDHVGFRCVSPVS